MTNSRTRWSSARSRAATAPRSSGCLVWGVLVILHRFVAFTLFFAAVLPELIDYIRETNPNVT